MGSALRIVEAPTGSKEFKDFIDVPYRVQGDNPVWVPPLRVQEKDKLDEKKNPFFEHAEMRKFVAYRDGEPVGRIAAIKDDAHNRKHNESTAMFGFFDTVKDPEVAAALFEHAEQAGREWGMDRMRGPVNPSVNEDLGVLMNAYDQPPVIMMPYNPPYYVQYIEEQGYSKAMDLYAYHVSVETFSEKTIRGAELIRKRTKLNYRHMDGKKNFWRDALKIWDLYNRAWEDNWGAVPMTEEEFRHLANNLKSIADFDLIGMAEDDEGHLVGFSLALPNINEALIRIRDGRLLPFGLPKLLWHTRKGAINSVRVIIMGVEEKYRGRGVDAVFHYDNLVVARRKGYDWGEISWVLETNTMMNRVADMVGAKKYKTYRVYEKPLGGVWS